MSSRDVGSESNLLSEFAVTIFIALGLGLPIAYFIIWICS
jgi:hypothetical protein